MAPLGAGGMGEVYRARDTRLERTVAIKILPAQLSTDPVRKQRFEREAKTISGLNHPNICVLHDVGSQDGVEYLVMECVEGESLAKRLDKGALPLEQVLKYGSQIADALDKAHRSGVVHRDLKPGNIMLTATGAKLLDFGLAKPAAPLATLATLSATKADSPVTQQGTIVGTFQYMSPEQVEGKELDGRSDIFSLGVVLYEMLTGQKAFKGKSQLSVASAILEKEPEPISTLKPMTPPSLDRVIRRCLAKDPEERWQTARDLALELKWIGEAGSQTAVPVFGPPSRRSLWVWMGVVVTAILLLQAAMVAIVFMRGSAPANATHVVRASLILSEPLAGAFTANPGAPFALSADGSRLVFAGAHSDKPSQLYIQDLDQGTATPIAGTEGATEPFFSPDGQSVGFFADGKLRKVALQGGPASTIADAAIPHGANWASDGNIVYAPTLGSGLMRISSFGGSPQTLTSPNTAQRELSHRWPQVLPGNNAVLFTVQSGTQATYDEAHIAALSLETGKWKTVIEGGSYARYVSSGHIVYAHSGTLMAVPFDVKKLEVTGPAAAVQDGVVTTLATSGGAEYDVSESGLLAYVPGSARPPERSLAWVDRKGVAKDLPAALNTYASPRISPDGKRMAVQVMSGGPQDLWIYDFARNTLMRFTFDGGAAFPLWTPDGRRLIYRTRSPSFAFRSKPTEGQGTEQSLLGKDFDDLSATPASVSPDGKILLLGQHGPTGAGGAYALSLDGTGTIAPVLQSSFSQIQAEFSPNGHWIVYTSNESGRDEIYLQPYPGPGGKWMLSTDGGAFPRWAHSGREIFFRNEDKMMVVPVETQPSILAGTPRMLFRGGGYVPQGNYDVSLDDQHLLMLKEKDTPASLKELSIALNWTEDLRRHVPRTTK